MKETTALCAKCWSRVKCKCMKDMEQRFETYLTEHCPPTGKLISEVACGFAKAEIALAFEATKVEERFQQGIVSKKYTPMDIAYNSALSAKAQKEKEYLNQLNK